jgi:hypothetical protein
MDQEPVVYRQNPRPVGFEVVFRLSPGRLEVDGMRRVDDVRLDGIEQVRLTYQPRSFSNRVFRTKLTLKDGKRVNVTSLSWRSMLEARSQDAEYGAFVRALLAEIGRANPACRFVAGRPPVIWLLVALFSAASLVAIAAFAWQAFSTGATAVAAFAAFLLAAGVWQLEPLVRLNRPRRFTPDAPPADLVP